MKMPATTNSKVEAKPAADVGDAAKQCLNCLEKKVRNLEKRKGRIEQNQEKAKKGVKLEKEQEDSLQQYDQVMHNLEFARELFKQFQQINQEHEKVARKQAKRERVERQALEIKRISEILQLQALLDLLGTDTVREDFKTGQHGALILTEDNLNQLDELYQAISPSRDDSGDDYPQRLTLAAEHLVNYLDGKDRQVVGTTYKELKGLITLIIECGYFTKDKSLESTEDVTEPSQETESAEAAAEVPESGDLASSSEKDQSSDSQQPQQPLDLGLITADTAQPQQEIPTQTFTGIERNAYLPPSSMPYQAEVNPHFTQASQPVLPQIPDYPSFTNGPFQFIQASYIMPETTGIIDPAVIVAQPAVSSSLQFMPHMAPQIQQLPTQSHQQRQQNQTVGTVVDLTGQHNSSASHHPQQVMQEYTAQSYSHDQMTDQQNMQERKFQMNASAPVFQSMYSPVHPPDMAGGLVPSAVPQPPVPAVAEAHMSVPVVEFSNKSIPSGDFGQTGAGDYHHTGQESEFPSSVYPNTISSHSDFQGGHSGEGSSIGGAGGNPVQNGGRGSSTNNNQGGRGGAYNSYSTSNSYRSDGYQSNYNSYNKNRFGGGGGGSYQKRGGMNNPGDGSYSRGWGSAGRGGGMRGGVSRGGSGGSRGTSKGSFSRSMPTQ